ncbi:2-oxoglutarate and iron-dependent oxygenase JMJD4 [Sesamum angolense]|uniref:2-oxoglutarate and iron-dependent oxygenase JMJD4 n=1 Tax=Sesamum angolense TaxID=2727404 RepID=A0AAE1WJX7_9LAMI|nr:2-oxoglutarate and iron-dependent oxygenase JMJD4 [Sesamum angolense]
MKMVMGLSYRERERERERENGLKIGGKVEKVNGKELSYGDFVEKYLARNQPVILTGLTEDWRACKDWVSDDGKPNLRFFSTHFGGSRVQVADCGTREFTDQKRIEMIGIFVKVCLKQRLLFSLVFCQNEYPEYVAYRTPIFFLDDWLNLYLDKYRMHDNPDSYQERDEASCSDYRFVYMGAKGTWTPLHADVFRSYSWSANICGRKHWYFLSPDQHHLVHDRYMKSSVYDISEDVCKMKYPGFEKGDLVGIKNPMPTVNNDFQEDTISINHNWFNAYNISWVWDLLLREYHEAKGYIEDIKDICDDFEGLCQRNLAANAGMDFRDFFVFMIRFAVANLLLLYQLTSDKRNINWNSSEIARHLLFNLKSIQCIALKMKSVAAWENRGINLMETIVDHSFVEFCNVLGRTCNMTALFRKVLVRYTVIHIRSFGDSAAMWGHYAVEEAFLVITDTKYDLRSGKSNWTAKDT